jgi:hypothetical protein
VVLDIDLYRGVVVLIPSGFYSLLLRVVLDDGKDLRPAAQRVTLWTIVCFNALVKSD